MFKIGDLVKFKEEINSDEMAIVVDVQPGWIDVLFAGDKKPYRIHQEFAWFKKLVVIASV